MTSQINYTTIDATFPIAGQNNDSQGFRDNFSSIKTALQNAKAEITDLQSNGAIINGDNNFGGHLIYNAEFKFNRKTVYDLGTLSGSVNVDYQNAQIQTLTTGGNITLSFTNWPSSTKLGSILLIIVLSDDSHTITYPGTIYKPALWDEPATAGTYMLEFTTFNNGATIYLSNKIGVSYYDPDHNTSPISFGGGGPGEPAYVVKTTTYTASNQDRIAADTSGGAWTLTLPGSPSEGDVVWVEDRFNTWKTNTLTIGRNGHTIDGDADDVLLTVPYRICFVFISGQWATKEYTPLFPFLT